MTRRRVPSTDYGGRVSLSRRKDGRWRVRWYDPPDSTDVRDQRERTFRADRESHARSFAAELSSGISTHGADATQQLSRRETPWEVVVERWLQIKAADWQADTAQQNRQLLERWASPHLTGRPVSSLRLEDYQRVFGYMTSAGRTGSRTRVRTLLAQVERWAAANDYRDLRVFPVRSFRTARLGGSVRTVGTGGEYVPPAMRPDRARIDRLAAAVAHVGRKPKWWRTLQCELAATSGIRLGESFALRTCHVDLEAGTLAVNWQYVMMPGDPAVLKRPKTERTRQTLIVPTLLDSLARRVAEAVNEPCQPPCPDCGGQTQCGLIFPAPQGGPHNRANFGSRVARPGYASTWDDPDPARRWPKRNDGKWLWSWHDLRHASAILLLDELKLAVGDAALLLGHSESVLLERYYGPAEGVITRAREAARMWATAASEPQGPC